MKETVKTIALWVLGGLYVVLALRRPEIPRPVEPQVELTPTFIAMKNDLAKARTDLAGAQAESRDCKVAMAAAAVDKEREARWTAAVEAESRGSPRAASKLYEEYAKLYPGTKKAQVATWKAKKLLADPEQKPAGPAGQGSGAPATP